MLGKTPFYKGEEKSKEINGFLAHYIAET